MDPTTRSGPLAPSFSNDYLPQVKQEHQPQQSETDTDSMASSPVSDSDKLSFPAAAAMLMAPQTIDDDLFFDFAMGEDGSSEDCESVKVENPTSTNPSGRRAMTPEERRKRRNEKERLRVQGVKERIEKLRHDMEALQERHNEMKKQLEQRLILRSGNSDDIQALMASYLSQPGATLDEHEAELRRRYIVLVRETEQLQFLKRALEDQLRPRLLDANTLKTMLAEEGSLALRPIEGPTEPRDNTTAREVIVSKAVEGETPIRMDPISIYETWLNEEPVTAEEARELVEETCREMMQALARTDWVEGFEGFGWRGSRRLDLDSSILQFRLSQVFKSVSANQLVQKTWTMLTNLEDYRRIQPQTQVLRILQRVNDECWVVGLGVGADRLRHGPVLVARAVIHGGYLITFRSLPLVRKDRAGDEYVRRRFVEREGGGLLVRIFSWYNFQERPNASGGVDCEVIFGGTGRNGDTHYLKQLQLEVVAGITRWQSAVGFSNFMFSPMLEGAQAQLNQHGDGAG